MMISSNLSDCPAMVVCIVNREACWGLTTMMPSPVASNVTLPLTMWATRVKCPSLTLAGCGLAGAGMVPLQPAKTSPEVASTNQVRVFTPLILAPACHGLDDGQNSFGRRRKRPARRRAGEVRFGEPESPGWANPIAGVVGWIEEAEGVIRFVFLVE